MGPGHITCVGTQKQGQEMPWSFVPSIIHQKAVSNTIIILPSVLVILAAWWLLNINYSRRSYTYAAILQYVHTQMADGRKNHRIIHNKRNTIGHQSSLLHKHVIIYADKPYTGHI